MNRNLLVLIALAAVAVALSSCGGDGEAETSTVERVISVKAELAQPRDVQVTRDFTGSLEGARQAVLYAKIAEAVESIMVTEGESVAANTVLVSLDKNGPSSNFLQAKSLLANAEKNYKKMEFLYAEGAVSESQFDAAKTEYEVQKASFEAASHLVNIRTPIAGMVTSVGVSEGDFVQVGQKLATVASTDKLRVKFGVKAEDVQYFNVGSQVNISAGQEVRPVKGKVVAMASSADPATRTFEVEAQIENAAGYYKPGMFVRISIVLEDLSGVVAVPRKSVVTLDDQPYVFVVRNGVAQKRKVDLGAEIDGHVVIDTGIAFGDTVVTLGQEYLDQGFKVKLASLSEGK